MISTNPDSSSSALSERLVPSKWKSPSVFPLSIKYGNSFSPEEVSALELSATNWSNGTENKIDFFDLSPSTFNELQSLDLYDDSEFGIYKLSSWPKDLPATALAVTQIYGNRYNIGSESEFIEIDHADILINFEKFTITTDQSWGYDLQTIVLHEMGHFLGLYHDKTSAEESIMYPTISRYIQGREPKLKDINEILKKYPVSPQVIAQKSNITVFKKSNIGMPITLILELYPDGAEIIKIKGNNGHDETIHTHHSHK